MNRFNFGNQITNGAQILSVAGRTYAGDVMNSNQRAENSERRRLADLSSGLNNLSEDERARYGKFRGDKMRQQMNDFYGTELEKGKGNMSMGSGSFSGSNQQAYNPQNSTQSKSNLSTQVKDKDNIIDVGEEIITERQKELGEQPKGVQEAVDVEYEWVDDLDSIGFENNSEQHELLNMKIGRDTKWLERYNSNNENLPTRRF